MQFNLTVTVIVVLYLLAMLFNAPSTMSSYYTALVAHDMAGAA